MSGLADAATVRRWRERPADYVRERFGVEPEPWQADVLRDFPASPRQAMQSCKGSGKTCIMAWIGWNMLETRPHPKGAAVSITKENLRDNLWAEMAKWQQRSDVLKNEFVWTGTRIFHKPFPETWFLSARAFSKSATVEELQATLAGTHADYVFFLVDESGAIPPPVMVAADAALSSCIEGHLMQAGNPLLHSGALYVAVKAEHAKWKVYEITGDPDDPKRSSRVSIEWAREQIAEYGRDHPYVMVNVLGKFAPSSINSLLSTEEVEEAAHRQYKESDVAHAARILGVDVARQGDDASCIFPRQGLVALAPKMLRNADSNSGASAVINQAQEWDADAIFVDATGGYGWGWIDALKTRGHAAIGVQFAGRPLDERQFANKRAEIHWAVAKWIREGGLIPDIANLKRALAETTYTHVGDRIILEPKEAIKARLGFSPDEADALALTFSHPVSAKPRELQRFPQLLAMRKRQREEWSPLAALNHDGYGMMR
jgi:phage terminase large subunit